MAEAMPLSKTGLLLICLKPRLNQDRKSTRLNSSHLGISYAVFCLKKKHLSYASSLCGACSSVCPVKIDLHHHLLQNRRNATEAGATKSSERLLCVARRWAILHP